MPASPLACQAEAAACQAPAAACPCQVPATLHLPACLPDMCAPLPTFLLSRSRHLAAGSEEDISKPQALFVTCPPWHLLRIWAEQQIH
jgi:hypothetical protein